MSALQVSSVEQELDELRGRFAHWRATRESDQERIPQALWDEAVKISRQLPNSRVPILLAARCVCVRLLHPRARCREHP